MKNLDIWLAIALGLSEALSLIPQVKANGIFQLLWGLLIKLKPSPKVMPEE